MFTSALKESKPSEKVELLTYEVGFKAILANLTNLWLTLWSLMNQQSVLV